MTDFPNTPVPTPQSQGKKVTPGAVSPDSKPTVEDVEKEDVKHWDMPIEPAKKKSGTRLAETW